MRGAGRGRDCHFDPKSKQQQQAWRAGGEGEQHVLKHIRNELLHVGDLRAEDHDTESGLIQSISEKISLFRRETHWTKSHSCSFPWQILEDFDRVIRCCRDVWHCQPASGDMEVSVVGENYRASSLYLSRHLCSSYYSSWNHQDLPDCNCPLNTEPGTAYLCWWKWLSIDFHQRSVWTFYFLRLTERSNMSGSITNRVPTKPKQTHSFQTYLVLEWQSLTVWFLIK